MVDLSIEIRPGQVYKARLKNGQSVAVKARPMAFSMAFFLDQQNGNDM